MTEPLTLFRPLVFLDCESTGLDVHSDRIVEIALIKLHPDGNREEWQHLVHPGRAIPEAATAVHGIDDSKVADEPSFAEIAPQLRAFLGRCDLCGFGIRRFDLPLLEQEFRRCGQEVFFQDRAVVDLMELYHRLWPRNLSGAVRDYLDTRHEHAHSAVHDADICIDLLQAMLKQHELLPRRVRDLEQWLQTAHATTTHLIAYHDGKPHFTFGRHRQRALADVAKDDPAYLRWIMAEPFPEALKQQVRAALTVRFSEDEIGDPVSVNFVD